MTDREKFDISEAKERIFARDRYICQNCFESIYTWNTPQLAHIISQSKANIKKYGTEIIHSDYNMLSACSLAYNGYLACGKSREAAKAEEIRRKYETTQSK